jgi:hypothetical protein
VKNLGKVKPGPSSEGVPAFSCLIIKLTVGNVVKRALHTDSFYDKLGVFKLKIKTNERIEEMSDATQSAATALAAVSPGAIGTPAGIAAIIGLANALMAGAQAYANLVLANRITLLQAVVTPAVLPSETSIQKIAPAFNECVAAAQFVGQVNALNSAIAQIRATDSTGAPAAAFYAGIPNGTKSGWAANLLAATATFEAMELEPLLTV